jgi:hypothetical protein
MEVRLFTSFLPLPPVNADIRENNFVTHGNSTHIFNFVALHSERDLNGVENPAKGETCRIYYNVNNTRVYPKVSGLR